MGNSVTAAVPFLVQGIGKTNVFNSLVEADFGVDINKVLGLFLFFWEFFLHIVRGEYERTSRQDGTEQGVCIRSSTRLTWRKLTRTFYFWLFLLVELEKHSSPSKPVLCVLMMEQNEQSVITKSVMNGPFFMYWLLLPDDGTISSRRNW